MNPKSLSRVFGGYLLTRLILVGSISIIILIGIFIVLLRKYNNLQPL